MVYSTFKSIYSTRPNKCFIIFYDYKFFIYYKNY